MVLYIISLFLFMDFRLLELMLRPDASVEFAIEGAAILGSLARGTF